MTRKQAIRIERELRSIGVYKPYVSTEGDVLVIESYPLTAYARNGFDHEMGPTHEVKITDASLARIGQDSTIGTLRVFLGQDLVSVVGKALMGFHAPAYERAAQQDREALARTA